MESLVGLSPVDCWHGLHNPHSSAGPGPVEAVDCGGERARERSPTYVESIGFRRHPVHPDRPMQAEKRRQRPFPICLPAAGRLHIYGWIGGKAPPFIHALAVSYFFKVIRSLLLVFLWSRVHTFGIRQISRFSV